MATGKERDRRFRGERRRQARRLTALQRDTAREVTRLLRVADERARAALAAAPTEWQAWHLPQLRQTVAAALADLEADAGAALSGAGEKAWTAGVDLVDRPLAAAGVEIAAVLPDIDTRQLGALRAFMTDRMKDISTQAANRINTELGLVAIGAQDTTVAVGRIGDILGRGARGRALTVLRTELGRAYATATQARLEQASEILPGLRKQWRRSGKRHSRADHDLADGQVQPVDRPFLVGGIGLMFPRDPKAPARATINCGCESLPFMEDWEMSRPGRQPFSAGEIATSPSRRAIEQIVDEVEIPDLARDADFRSFLAGGAARHIPVARLPAALADQVGSRVRTVLLSRETAGKQARRHGDVTAADYARLKKMMSEAEVLADPRGALVFQARVGGQWWRAVVKPTEEKGELFLSTLHRLRPAQRDRARATQPIIRE